MNQNKFKIGLVVAKPNSEKEELKKFSQNKESDILLFPEGFLSSDNLSFAQEIARENKKWIISGMDDKREKDKKFETAIIINSFGDIIGEHKKTSLTTSEIEKGYSQGDSIKTIETDFGKIGISICYEIHFPEISRIFALSGAKIIFNPIGTGMWHEDQFQVWNNIASARASENKIFVVGCSHFNDQIPIAFAYDPNGKMIAQSKNKNEVINIILDFDEYKKIKKHFDRRRPELYGDLVSQDY